LVETIEKMVNNRGKLIEMAKASLELGRPQAAETIAHLAIQLKSGFKQ
jgi:UDP-N-acetylglucosamine--N-acetylmuramyl-(pentapeptide) pyrophosphoryl-undecaprenol N-acetylglucosamine transferase